MNITTDYRGPLAGLNVIDFGHYYAGPMAGMLLADQGANVIRIVKPGERELPGPQYRLLNRNKKLLKLDLKTEEGRIQALSLIERADVLIENFRPGVMKRLKLDYSSVKELNPGLVYLSLPGFASTDKERAHIQAWEGILGAVACNYTEIHMLRRSLGFPPVYSAVPQCSTYGAMHGASAVMVALVSRLAHGVGTVIEVPLADAGLTANSWKIGSNPTPPEQLKPLVFSAEDTAAMQAEKLDKIARETNIGLFKFFTCADDRKILFLTVYPIDWEFLKVLGIDEQVRREGFVSAGQWDAHENNIAFYAGMSAERKQKLEQLIANKIRTKSAEEWEEKLTKIGGIVVRTRNEWFASEPMRKSGLLASMNDGQSVLTVPGRLVDVDGPGENLISNTFHEPKPIAFSEAEASLHNTHTQFVQGKPFALKKGDLLKGLKVLDLANMVAGPMISVNLAAYGAEVITMAPPRARHYPMGLTTIPGINQGKRSILVDVATAQGRGILERLITWADVVVHNILDDTAKRLGVSHAQLQAINPNVISCQFSAFGGTWRGLGGWENRPGVEQTAGQAVNGVMTQYGTPESPHWHGMASCSDIPGGPSGAFAVLLAVYQKRRTGYAAEARSSLVRVGNYTQLPWMIAENGQSDWGEPNGQFALGKHWWQRLYACRDRYIFVDSGLKRAQTLAEIVTGQQDAEVTDMERAFAEHDCSHWTDTLDAANIACHQVLDATDILDTAKIRNVGNDEADETTGESFELLCWQDHPSGKPITMPGGQHTLVGENHSYKRLRAALRLGGHTREILQELGYSDTDIEEMIRIKVAHEYFPPLGSKDAYFFPFEEKR